MTKHTPIPYRVERNHAAGNVVHLAILGADDDMPCSITPMAWLRPVDEANAEFICRACNNHDALLAACRAIVDAWADGDLASAARQCAAAIAMTEPPKPVSTAPKK